jgi:hypothetical protein
MNERKRGGNEKGILHRRLHCSPTGPWNKLDQIESKAKQFKHTPLDNPPSL